MFPAERRVKDALHRQDFFFLKFFRFAEHAFSCHSREVGRASFEEDPLFLHYNLCSLSAYALNRCFWLLQLIQNNATSSISPLGWQLAAVSYTTYVLYIKCIE